LIRIPIRAVDECLQKDGRLAQEFARLYDMRDAALRRSRDSYLAADSPEEHLLPVNMRRPQREPDDDAEA